ncbi:PAS domain S-box protein [Ketobacter nezhaii]|uniref:PAS domain S-box protein n=1 Tax=Ketobacter sp. MCCC 1A13808 TaxID=2602738 RepID=UPI000F0D276B|nr:PAS domain S-box protein [Ketobacter sp. MCCC 1A13808]RLP53016.1 MAG: PAS domain S-box protein [Ketobacter sp.]
MNFGRNILISVVLSVLLLGLISLMSNLDEEYDALSDDLGQALDSQMLISHVIRELGYNGFIHNFKNYLLRGDEEYYQATAASFQRLDRLLKSGLNRDTDPVLQAFFEQIQDTVYEYEANLELVRQYRSQGLGVSEIDKRVRVDDRAASEALSQLISQLQTNAARLLHQIKRDQSDVRNQLLTVAMATMLVAIVLCLIGWYIAARSWISRKEIDQLASKQKLLDAAPNPILVVSENGEIVVANRGSESIFETAKEQLIGRSIDDFIPPEIDLADISKRDAFFRSQASRTRVNPVLLQTPNGVKKEVEVQVGLYEVEGQKFAVANLLDVSNVTHLRLKAEQIEQRFRATFEMAPIGIAQVSLEGRFLKVNKKMEEIFGYSRYELESKHITDVTYKEDVDVSKYVMGRFQSNDSDHFRMEKRYQHKNGEIIWSNLTTTLYRDSLGKPEYLISIIEDISQRKQFEADLLESEAKFKTIANHVKGVVWMATPGMEKVLFASEYFEKLWGIPVESLKSKPAAFLDAIVEEDKPRVIKELDNHRHGNWDVEYRIKASDGKVHHIHDEGNPVRGANGAILYLVGLARDVTSEKVAIEKLEKTNRHLEQLAKFDPLTMAVRRQYALTDFEECIALHRRYGSDSTLIFIDLNEFKSVNDRFGHEGGDQLLIEFARFMRSNIRETDGFYRYAGDEFLVLLRETNADKATHFISKLQATLPQVEMDGKEWVTIGFACGACSLDGSDVQGANHWIKLADEEMYKVKALLKRGKEIAGNGA